MSKKYCSRCAIFDREKIATTKVMIYGLNLPVCAKCKKEVEDEQSRY